MGAPALSFTHKLSVPRQKLLRLLGRAIADFTLIEPGDRILVALSGGKDSYSMMTLLEDERRRAPVHFSLLAWHLDQGQPGYDGAPLQRWLESRGFEHVIERQDTYSVVLEHVPEGKTYCSLCSRLRRGILYSAAQRLGCNKIALGHHREDVIETLLLNLFFSGQLKAMPPKLVSDDGRNVVIRPLTYCPEELLATFAREEAFPILPCRLCGSQEGAQREETKRLLRELEERIPHVRGSMLAALMNVRPTHLLDRELWRRLGAVSAEEHEPVRLRVPDVLSSARFDDSLA
jgi:tRNA 2-thiocytidine biosynthesis protein TtcA